jgi:hypothetical protein
VVVFGHVTIIGLLRPEDESLTELDCEEADETGTKGVDAEEAVDSVDWDCRKEMTTKSCLAALAAGNCGSQRQNLATT